MLCTGEDITIEGLAMLIKETVGFGGMLFFNTDKPDGTMKKLTDPTKLNRMGWKHKTDLKQGVKQLYQWYLASLVLASSQGSIVRLADMFYQDSRFLTSWQSS